MRPKVIVNAAMSVDGKIALVGGKRIRISDEEDFRRVHILRSRVDAILVGINTILLDDPKLTVKEKFVPGARNPIRIVLDSKFRIPENARVLNSDARTIVATTEDAPERDVGAEVIKCGRGRVDLNCLLETLGRMGIETLMVEGGGTVINSFLREGLVDEFSVFIGSVVIGGGAPTLVEGEGARDESQVIRLRLKECVRLGYGALLIYGVEE